MSLAIYAIIAAVALQRLAEVIYAARNTRALLARGAVEIGASHYPVMVTLHTAWLATILLALPSPRAFYALPFALFILMQLGRLWVLKTLGPWWTTRIITMADAPLIRTGPYRFVRHPNYLIVAGEIALLPLAFGEWRVALIFSILNAMILAWRIRAENGALAPRRQL